MIVEIPSSPGTPWHVENGAKKLALRAQLPGALVFDFAAESLRAARAAGVCAEDRLFLALPASWLVNSPAVSRVMRRWALPPDRSTWLALMAVLERGPEEWMAKRAESRVAARDAVGALGAEPYLVEAVSKVLAGAVGQHELGVAESGPDRLRSRVRAVHIAAVHRHDQWHLRCHAPNRVAGGHRVVSMNELERERLVQPR